MDELFRNESSDIKEEVYSEPMQPEMRNSQLSEDTADLKHGQTERLTENPETSRPTAAPAGAEVLKASDPSHVTYSWVNPKIHSEQTAEEAIPNNPWGAGSSAAWSGAGSRQASDRSNNQWGNQNLSGQNQNYTEYRQSAGNQAGNQAGPIFQPAGDLSSGKRRKTRKTAGRQPMSTGKKWAATVAMAVVFGLVSGLVFTGVTMAGRALTHQEKTERVESAAVSPVLEKASTDAASSQPTPRPVSTGGTVADVASQCMPSLVTISTISVEEMRSFFGQTQQYEVSGAGTGVIVGQNDTELLIATNNHVIAGAKSLSVGFIDETAVSGSVKGYDASTDLAVVAVKVADIPAETMSQIRICEMGNSDELVLGEQVVAIGNALGYGQSVTSGYISAFDRELSLVDNSGYSFTSTGLIQTDASINSGNSGGALLNMRGQLIGINEAKRSGSSTSASVDNIGFAIPISKAEPILENLMTLTTREKVDSDHAAYIGITCADVSAETAQMYNMPTGVCLTSIMENSPAEAAGLKKGDILTSFDGREVNSYSELTDHLQYYAAGETVELIVQRANDGEYTEQYITLVLGSASDMPENYQSGSQGAGNGVQP